MKALFKRNGIVSMVQVYNIYATDEPFIVHLITKYGRYTCQDIPKEVYICTVREGYSSYGDVDFSQYEFEPEELDYEHVAERLSASYFTLPSGAQWCFSGFGGGSKYGLCA